MTLTTTAIIGTLNLELLLGPLDELPARGHQRLVNRFQMRKAGSAASVGLVLAALGQRPRLFGTVGDDDAGRDLLHYLGGRGLDLAGVQTVPSRHTGICVSITGRSGAHRYISSLGAINATTCARLMRRRSVLQACDTALLTGYFVLPGLGFEGTRRLFRWLRQHGKTVALDTGTDPSGWPARSRTQVRQLLAHVHVFLPNRDEARAITSKRDPASAARALRALGPELVFVKLESRGGLVATRDAVHRHPGFPRKVKDTTAAGEAFNAGVLHALRLGLSPRDALSFANAAAARFVESANPAACTFRRVLALVDTATRKQALLGRRRLRE